MIFDGRHRVVAPPVEELGQFAELLLPAHQRGLLGQEELRAELGLGLEPGVEAEVPGAVLVVLEVGELGGAIAGGTGRYISIKNKSIIFIIYMKLIEINQLAMLKPEVADKAHSHRRPELGLPEELNLLHVLAEDGEAPLVLGHALVLLVVHLDKLLEGPVRLQIPQGRLGR